MARHSEDKAEPKARRGITRRGLLVGGGVGVGLLLAWGVWPRRYEPALPLAEGETMMNALLKIGRDGRVIVMLPQIELGQGVSTTLPQILADELGADWRHVAVEPAPIGPLYANTLLAGELAEGALPDMVADLADGMVAEIATREALMLTGGSTSTRAFEPRLREAGRAARALLAMAAAPRWDVDWRTLDAHGGFIRHGEEAVPFGELAETAAGLTVPDDLPVRQSRANRLIGQSLPRLDGPSKVDGTALFAADVRQPDMVYAAVHNAPPYGRLVRCNEAAAARFPETLVVFQNPGWVGVAAVNSWAADRAVAALDARFEVPRGLPDSAAVDAALADALDNGEAESVIARGDVAGAFAAEGPSATYAVDLAASAPPEPLTATAWWRGNRLDLWAPTQAPGLARAAAAGAIGLPESAVTLYAMPFVGGGYGRKMEMDAIRQAAVMSHAMQRPVQLTWSRHEDIRHDRFRPAASARLDARLATNGQISAWRARIAAPATMRETAARIGLGTRLFVGSRDPVAGADPPYAIPHVGIDHVPAPIGVETGLWRSGSLSYTCFFTESFVDELARGFGLEPLSFRMQMLGDNPRLARALTTATALGGWDGGPSGSGMGLAALSAFGSHIAALVEVEVGADRRVRVLRAVCAVDCGRVVHPHIVRQQIEGGLIHGIAAAVGPRLEIVDGMPVARTLGDLDLPILANSPEIVVEVLDSEEAPGGVTELAVPVAAPAIANAVHALTGERLRRLPLRLGTAA